MAHRVLVHQLPFLSCSMKALVRVRNFDYFLATSAAKNCTKKIMIKSAASAASAKGDCASSRLDHGLKFYVNQGGCAGSRLISEFSDCGLLLRPFLILRHCKTLFPAALRVFTLLASFARSLRQSAVCPQTCAIQRAVVDTSSMYRRR